MCGRTLFATPLKPKMQLKVDNVCGMALHGTQMVFVDGWNVRSVDIVTGAELFPSMIIDDLPMSVAISPDGATFVTGSREGTVIVWSMGGGNQLRRLDGHIGSTVYGLAFGPNGQLVTASYDHTAIIWDMQTGTKLHCLQHNDCVTSVAISLSGKYVVTGSTDNSARVWEMSTGCLLQARVSLGSNVTSVAFSPDASKVLIGTGLGDVIICDIRTGAAPRHLPKHEAAVTSIMMVGTKVITAALDDSMRVYKYIDTGYVSMEQWSTFGQIVSLQKWGDKLVTMSDHGKVCMHTMFGWRSWFF